MGEENEDIVDIFADESDPLLSEQAECRDVTVGEKTGTETKKSEPADEAKALAELPDYKPIEKDKERSMDDGEIDVCLTLQAADRLDESKELTSEQKVDSSLNEIIASNEIREDRKRHFNLTQEETYIVRDHKRKYMMKNGLQLCLQPRRDIAELSVQEAGDELARCLDEPKKMLMEDTIKTLGLEQALELLTQTAEIQENDGMSTQDGIPKRPGGVFISLLKQKVTSEQLKSIFQRDRQLDNQSKKKRKRLKVKQDKLKAAQYKKRMDRELEALEKKRWNEMPDVNLEKRFGLANHSDEDEGEIMDVDIAEPTLLCDNSNSMSTANENGCHGDDESGEVKQFGNHDNKMINE